MILLFPVINNGCHFFEKQDSSENRKLAEWPQLENSSIDTYVKGLESYLIDHLHIRNNAIRFHNRLNVFVFRSSPSGVKALVGKNNWLYLSGEELKTYAGIELFKEQELIEFKHEILRREKIISGYNAKLIMAFVPNKANVYPEFMPDHLIKSVQYGYGQQMHLYLEKNGIHMIDLYTLLMNNKSNRDIYFKTDNHWNDLGAFIGANAILKEMSSRYPGIQLLDTINFPIRTEKETNGGVAMMLNVEKEVIDFNHSPRPINGFKSVLDKKKKYPVIKNFPFPWEYEQVYQRNNTSLPNVLIIRDSYGKRLLPYLAEQCNNCVAIWDSWNYGLNEEIIKDVKPDFVVYLISESQLKNLMKYAKK